MRYRLQKGDQVVVVLVVAVITVAVITVVVITVVVTLGGIVGVAVETNVGSGDGFAVGCVDGIACGSNVGFNVVLT